MLLPGAKLRSRAHRWVLRECAVHGLAQVRGQRGLVAAVQRVLEAAVRQRCLQLLRAADQQAAQEHLLVTTLLC